jgi:uncharacterized protein (TIGR02145 family)
MKTINRIWLFQFIITGLVLIFPNSCKKYEDKNNPSGSITDKDGNVYTSVTIGAQVWMVENLKTTKYNDGTFIPNVTDETAWYNLTTAAYCWYDNEISNKTTYGALYNWYVVNTGKLCPSGWHVPAETEWSDLINYLGGQDIAGGKMKEIGLAHWKDVNVGATNESGFTALPGGLRSNFGSFGTLGLNGHWWSATPYSPDPHFAISLEIYDAAAEAYLEHVTYAKNSISVRCIKD